MLYGLNSHIIERIQAVFVKYSEIDKVILYGSRAIGNYKIGSDIDLTIVGNDIDLLLLHKIENELEELLLPYKFDISIINHIRNENLLDHIDRIGVEFYIKSSNSSL